MQCLVLVCTVFVYNETHSGSEVVCLTQDRGVAGSSLTGGTVEPGACAFVKRREPGFLLSVYPLDE